jgi:hypothetical protein
MVNSAASCKGNSGFRNSSGLISIQIAIIIAEHIHTSWRVRLRLTPLFQTLYQNLLSSPKARTVSTPNHLNMPVSFRASYWGFFCRRGHLVILFAGVSRGYFLWNAFRSPSRESTSPLPACKQMDFQCRICIGNPRHGV